MIIVEICFDCECAFNKKTIAKVTAQKMKFPLKISSVNVIKSAVSCGFGHIY